MSNTDKLYWHFLPPDGRLQYGDRKLVVVGERLMLPPDTKIIPCKVGYHASLRAIDALQYAPGPIVCRVTLQGEKIPYGDPVDKYVAEGRTVLWMADATDALREFARWCALQVIDLWDAPPVVREYLETGDENLRAAAWDAARSAPWDVAAGSAPWDAARNAARDVASGAAAGDATARSAQNERLEKMLLTLEVKS